MKLSKKAITALSFTVGACMFVSTALADMAIGSGYDRLKDAAKHTAEQMENGLDNYTIEGLFTLKDNGQTLTEASTFTKIDAVKKAFEENTVTQHWNGETTSHYSYRDQQRSIWKNEMEDKYYVTEYARDIDRWNRFTNPFNEEGAPEIEKIVDALVGSLKDYVQMEELAEGGKVYSGSLSEAQVPAVVNAVASFGIKQILRDQGSMDRNAQLPKIESDVFVKKVTGTALETKAGLLEGVTGDVLLSGKDKSGAEHEVTLNFVFKLSDVGSTKVEAPNLTGKEVEKVSDSGGFSSKYAGTYKNNIIIEKDGEFVKIGERTLEIKSVDSEKVTGAFTETVKPGYEGDYPNPYRFTFEYDQNQSRPMPLFTYTNSAGEQENGQLHPSGNGKIYLDLNIEILDENSYRSHGSNNFDGELIRVFEE